MKSYFVLLLVIDIAVNLLALFALGFKVHLSFNLGIILFIPITSISLIILYNYFKYCDEQFFNIISNKIHTVTDEICNDCIIHLKKSIISIMMIITLYFLIFSRSFICECKELEIKPSDVLITIHAFITVFGGFATIVMLLDEIFTNTEQTMFCYFIWAFISAIRNIIYALTCHYTIISIIVSLIIDLSIIVYHTYDFKYIYNNLMICKE